MIPKATSATKTAVQMAPRRRGRAAWTAGGGSATVPTSIGAVPATGPAASAGVMAGPAAATGPDVAAAAVPLRALSAAAASAAPVGQRSAGFLAMARATTSRTWPGTSSGSGGGSSLR
jgi:hypothetical protein